MIAPNPTQAGCEPERRREAAIAGKRLLAVYFEWPTPIAFRHARHR